MIAVFLCAPFLSANPSKVIRHPATGVANEYMVVLANQDLPSSAVAGVAQSVAAAYGIEIVNVWEYSLRGFLGQGTDQNFEAMAGDPRVRFIEQNFRTDAPKPEMSATQWTWFNGQYMWHLDRLDEPSWAQRDSQHNMCTEGRSVTAYVIDTGVQADHEQFETPSRVVHSVDFSRDRSDSGEVFTDDVTNGCTAPGYANPNAWHGTAVASILAGTQVGAAKTRIVSLKVASCGLEILVADLIDATNWIASEFDNPFHGDPGVINHSGYVPLWVDAHDPPGSDFSAYSQAVENLTLDTNMPFFTSADNFSADACRFSPNDRGRTAARAGAVMVVGGTSAGEGGDNNDYRFQYWVNGSQDVGRDSGSNAGACVGLYAPAVSIYAARHSAHPVDYDRASGTSFSSPIVAAIAARYMEQQQTQTGVTPGRDAVYTWLLSNSSATIMNVQTPQYWYCAPYLVDEITYTSNPPANCSTDRWGQNGPGTEPYYFPSVGNESGARMVYWDEGVCE